MNDCVVEMMVILVSVCVFFILVSLIYKLCRSIKYRSDCKRIMKSRRYWLLLFMMVPCFLQSLHFSIRMDMYIRTVMSSFETIFKNVGLVLCILFVVKKASKPLPERQSYINLIRGLFVFGVIINAIFYF